MSKPYHPASGTEGVYFMAEFCDICWHDRNEDCPILAASFLGQVPEWIMDDDYTNERCTAFTEKEPKEFPADAKKQLSLFGGNA